MQMKTAGRLGKPAGRFVQSVLLPQAGKIMQSVSRVAAVFGIFLLLIVFQVTAAASPVSLQTGPERFDIQAERATLSEILAALSAQTGLKVVMYGAVGETKPFAVKAQSLEDALEQLLSDRNYVLFRRTGNDPASTQLSLWVYDRKTERQFFQQESKSSAVSNLSGGSEASPIKKPAPEEQRVAIDRFIRSLEAEMPLSEQITAESLTDSPFEGGAVRITEVVKGSALEKLGFSGGDICHNVNGSSVSSLDDFLANVKTPASSGIKISCYREDRQGNTIPKPIYIEPLAGQ